MTTVSIGASDPAAHRKALLVLIAGACIIGLSPICVRLAESAGAGGRPGVGPAAIGFWRLLIALPMMTALGLLESRHGDEGAFGRPTPMILITGLLFSADLICWHYGIRYTSVANATVLSNLTPILVTGVAWLVLKEKPRRIFLLGMSLAVAGAIGMALFKAGLNGAGTAKPSYFGDGLSALTAVWYGGYFLAVREARRTLSTSAIMIWTNLIGAPILLVSALLLHEHLLATTAVGWGALVLLAIVHVAGQGSLAWALGRLPTALTAVVVLVQPVVAAALGWAIFGEALTPLQGLAGLVALGGVAVAQLSARPVRPVEAPES